MTPMNYFSLSAGELGAESKIRLVKMGEPGEVFYELALDMLRVIEANNGAGRPTMMIVPVGPVGQYPIFTRLVQQRDVSLRDCWFINMDEYLGTDGQWVPFTHPLSFRRYMADEVYARLPGDLVMPAGQRVFPDPADPGQVQRIIDEVGGVDLCVAGLGINGHIAFNEPQPDLTPDAFATLPTRVLDITPVSRAVNAISSLGGALEAMPSCCVTVGMREILGARQVRVGCFRDWQRGAVREAAYGDVSAGFPVTLLQRHPDATIYASANTVQPPFEV